jgi:hypothetical protein
MNIKETIHLGRTLKNVNAVSEAFRELSEACTPDEWNLLHTSPRLSALLTACDELSDTLADADE